LVILPLDKSCIMCYIIRVDIMKEVRNV
jgi:hypothetical protein